MRLCLVTLFLLLLVALPCQAAVFTGNGNSGFGGTLGGGSLELTDDGTTISGVFTRGAGDLNDALVLYFDTGTGGFADTTAFSDDADGLRRAISGFDGANRSTVNFNSGFEADFAVAIDQGFGGLWQLASGGPNALSFVDSVNLTPTGTTTSATYSFSFDLAEIGISSGDSVDFVGTYLNSGNAFRSDEAIGDGIASGNPGVPSAISFTGSRTYVTAVPEPSSYALLGFGAVAYGWRRRRSRAKRTGFATS